MLNPLFTTTLHELRLDSRGRLRSCTLPQNTFVPLPQGLRSLDIIVGHGF
jgi:hypothetical protein